MMMVVDVELHELHALHRQQKMGRMRPEPNLAMDGSVRASELRFSGCCEGLGGMCSVSLELDRHFSASRSWTTFHHLQRCTLQ